MRPLRQDSPCQKTSGHKTLTIMGDSRPSGMVRWRTVEPVTQRAMPASPTSQPPMGQRPSYLASATGKCPPLLPDRRGSLQDDSHRQTPSANGYISRVQPTHFASWFVGGGVNPGQERS